MNLALSFLFSAIDFSSVIVLTLCVFRFKIKHHITQLIVLSLVMSLISKIFEYGGLSSVAPILQLIIMTLIFKLIFKESLFYSFIANVFASLVT